MPGINISASDRIAFIGKTGSGKTELAKFFLSRLNRVVVVDPKHTFKLDGFKNLKPGNWSLPVFKKDFRLIVRPRRHDDEELTDFMEVLNKTKNLTIYIDELATLTDMFPYTTAYLADVVRTGREKKVAVWSGMQRPRGTPRVYLSETETFFCFALRAKEDREYIRGYAGDEVMQKIPKFHFWHIRADEDQSNLMTLDKESGKIKLVNRKEVINSD